ncbi:MAG TPA: hypothetical protein VGW33_01885 [Terriglobia bacterium]|nr:hypothetical protein [Terriglobia bacterium]
MEMAMQVLFWDTLKVVLVSGLLAYAVLAASAYMKSGSGYKLSLGERDLLGSAANVLLWLGVKGLGGIISLGGAFVNFLSEPSAEVGEWLISRSPRLQHVVERPRRP